MTDRNGENHLIMKGDIAHVVSRCGYVAYRGKVLPMEDAGESVSSVVDEMLQDGMKVIAVARKKCGAANQINPADEADMILVGYLAFFDAPKKNRKGVHRGAETLEGHAEDPDGRSDGCGGFYLPQGGHSL